MTFYVIESAYIDMMHDENKVVYVKMNDQFPDKLSYTLTFNDATKFQSYTENVLEIWRRAKRNFPVLNDNFHLNWKIVEYQREEVVYES